MQIDTEHLSNLILKSSKITLVIAQSKPEDRKEILVSGDLNDLVLRSDGTLELWYNTGYEI